MSFNQPNSQAPKTRRIVVTGGPGGGKSTAVDLFRRELGEVVVVVPEAATLLFAGGFPRSDEEHARKSAQKAIYHVQRNLENVQSTLYPGRVLLCDRGTPDSAIYWPGKSEDFFTEFETSLEAELNRYDAVVFFESAAAGNLSIETGNPFRTENNTEATILDKRLKELWSNHKNFVFVPNHDSFMKKLQLGLEALESTIKKLRPNQ